MHLDGIFKIYLWSVLFKLCPFFFAISMVKVKEEEEKWTEKIIKRQLVCMNIEENRRIEEDTEINMVKRRESLIPS